MADNVVSSTDLYKKRKIAEAEISQDVAYTLFASGLNYGGRDVELKNRNTTTSLAIIFDVVDKHSYKRSVDKTKYATENKVNYSDHAVIEDGVFSFSARINSSPVYFVQNNVIDKDTDQENPAQSKRPEKALKVLEEIIESRSLVALVTEDRILENYILTSLEAERSSEEGAALVFQLEFTEFRSFTLGKTVLTTYTDPKKSTKKQKGAVNSSATDKDITVMQQQPNLLEGSTKDFYKKFAESKGLNIGVDKEVGTLHADGSFTDLEGNTSSTIPSNLLK